MVSAMGLLWAAVSLVRPAGADVEVFGEAAVDPDAEA
jgi:hypothetical protein